MLKSKEIGSTDNDFIVLLGVAGLVGFVGWRINQYTGLSTSTLILQIVLLVAGICVLWLGKRFGQISIRRHWSLVLMVFFWLMIPALNDWGGKNGDVVADSYREFMTFDRPIRKDNDYQPLDDWKTGSARPKWYTYLYWQVLIGLFLGSLKWIAIAVRRFFDD